MNDNEVHSALQQLVGQGELDGLCGTANPKLKEWLRDERNDLVYMDTVTRPEGAVLGNKSITDEFITSSGFSVKDFSDSTKEHECFVKVDRQEATFAVRVKRLILSLVTKLLRPGALYTVHNGVARAVTEGVDQRRSRSGEQQWLSMSLREESGLLYITRTGKCCCVLLIFGALSGAARTNPVKMGAALWVTKELHLREAAGVQQTAQLLSEMAREDLENIGELLADYLLQNADSDADCD
jgi:hypothetical protein